MRTGCAALIVAALVALLLWRPWHGVVEEPVASGPDDRITLTHDDVVSPVGAGAETAILVDADVGGPDGCRNDMRAPVPATFANLRLSTCDWPDEVLVLSVDDPVTWLVPGTGERLWTDATGEERVVDLGAARPVVPLRFYQVGPSSPVACKLVALADDATMDAAARAAVGCDVRNLELAFNLQRGGLAFSATLVDLSGISDVARAQIGCPRDSWCTCPSAAPSDPALYDPAVVNVYIVPEISNNGQGRVCPDLPRGFTYLAANRSAFTLAHELGHIFGLPHVDGTWEYAVPAEEAVHLDDLNLMFSTQGENADLRLGQAVRANVLPWSFINRVGLRPGGVVRECERDWSEDLPVSWKDHVEGASIDAACPRLPYR
jgi:hypothetical protein